MIFEGCYELELKFTEDDKTDVLTYCVRTWMYVDGELAGETYGMHVDHLEPDDRTDLTEEHKDAIYCYSTTILPKWQGHGLGRILKAYWLGAARERGFRMAVGHATSDAAINLNRQFGAVFGPGHQNWRGSKRNAVFYEMALE